MASEVDVDLIGRAIANAARSRFITTPNPWVGAVVAAQDGSLYDGATRPPGGPHAERVALDAAGAHAVGATVYTTLEPCNHTGRTGPCTDALVDARVARVVIGILDPDPQVAGTGVETLRSAGIEVEVGVRPSEVTAQLEPYLHHRRTGRPLVVLKMALSLDGRTAAADGSSQWITGPEARSAVHRLRAESDAILVGAGTVRIDDPSLTVRDWRPADDVEVGPGGLDPRRVVLGVAATGARVHPCTELSGSLAGVLDQLGSEGVMQLMVEGGAHVAAQFHADGLVDRYELFVAPAFFGGDDARPLFAGSGAPTMAHVWRGAITGVDRVGDDLHVTVVPSAR